VTAIAGNRPAFRQVVVWLENAVGFHAISSAISIGNFCQGKNCLLDKIQPGDYIVGKCAREAFFRRFGALGKNRGAPSFGTGFPARLNCLFF
jgi:hypothetical protein